MLTRLKDESSTLKVRYAVCRETLQKGGIGILTLLRNASASLISYSVVFVGSLIRWYFGYDMYEVTYQLLTFAADGGCDDSSIVQETNHRQHRNGVGRSRQLSASLRTYALERDFQATKLIPLLVAIGFAFKRRHCH